MEVSHWHASLSVKMLCTGKANYTINTEHIHTQTHTYTLMRLLMRVRYAAFQLQRYNFFMALLTPHNFPNKSIAAWQIECGRDKPRESRQSSKRSRKNDR